MSQASDALLTGFNSLLGSNGETVTPDFQVATLTAIVNRFGSYGTIQGVPLTTGIEFLITDATTAPSAAASITDGNSIKHTISRVRKFQNYYHCACYTFADLPTETVTIGAISYSAYIVEGVTGTDLEYGGFTAQDNFRAALDRDDVSTFPAEGNAVTFRSTSYRVTRVQRGETGEPVFVDFAPTTGRQQS